MYCLLYEQDLFDPSIGDVGNGNVCVITILVQMQNKQLILGQRWHQSFAPVR